MEIFSAKDCISFIKKNIEDHGGVFGYKAKLAETMGIQRSYLSNILTEKAYPTMEQAEKLTRFWKMSKLETDFFINLLSRDKAGTIELKQLYNQRLNELKKSRLDLSQRFQKNNISTEAQLKYYSSWLYSAIDVLVTIPDYNDVAKISKRLSISTEVAHKVLLDLENIGLVKNEKNK